jgi:hypothetical protein
MKGVIADCLKNLVVNKFGLDKWTKSLEMSGLSKNISFLAGQDIPDETILKVIDSVCKVLNITLLQAADAFGDYWVNDYAANIYKPFYKAETAKEFLLNMNNVHTIMTKNMPNAHPPQFEYEWENEKTLIMKYISNRGLIDFLVGLVKGVGKYYNEKLKISKIDNDKVKIIFN